MHKLYRLQQLAALCGQHFGAPLAPPATDFPADSHILLTLARRHRVQGLCWEAVRRLDLQVSEPVAAALAADRQLIAAQALRAIAASRDLTNAFAAESLPLLFLKGLTIGCIAYGDPFLKMASDLDILVRRSDLTAASQILAEIGYTPFIPATREEVASWHQTAKESVWIRQGGPAIELHTRLIDNHELLGKLDPFAVSPNLIEVSPGIRLPSLPPAELYAYLTVHGASSAWFRLKWLSDLAGLLAGKSSYEVEALHLRAVELGAGRASAWALLLCETLFGLDAACSQRLSLRDDPINRWLLRIGLAELLDEVEPTEQFFGTARIHLAQLLLKPGVGFAAREFRRQLRTVSLAR